VIPALFVAFPAVLFFSLLTRMGLNIPDLDDYIAILAFLNEMATSNTLPQRVSLFFASQLGEFKLFFLHGVCCLQLGLFGHINFFILGTIANGFVLLLALLLWKMFQPHREDYADRLVLFIPVSWLIFQIGYWDDLDWATPGLQHVVVLLFSFASIWLLFRETRLSFWAAMGMLVLAVASDGNGLLLVPVGLTILVVRRHYARILGWLAASAACIALYCYHYTEVPAPGGLHRSIVSVALGLHPGHVLACMGNATAFILPFQASSFVLGGLLCLFFAWMVLRGYVRRNPCVSCCVLFLLLTVTGIAGFRSDFGVTLLLVPRYTIYSTLLLIFAWYAVVEEFLQHRKVSFVNNGLLLGAVGAAILFALLMDLVGYNGLQRRDRMLIQAMSEFEYPTTQQPDPWPTPLYPMPGARGAADALEVRVRCKEVLLESIKLGIYQPPSLDGSNRHSIPLP
jgi:hypothetical protein